LNDATHPKPHIKVWGFSECVIEASFSHWTQHAPRHGGTARARRPPRDAARRARGPAARGPKRSSRASRRPTGAPRKSRRSTPSAVQRRGGAAKRDAEGLGAERQETALGRWTLNLFASHVYVLAPRYELQSCRGESAGVAKRPRERSPTRKPLTLRFANFCIAVCGQSSFQPFLLTLAETPPVSFAPYVRCTSQQPNVHHGGPAGSNPALPSLTLRTRCTTFYPRPH
jgi:hypothetical protein